MDHVSSRTAKIWERKAACIPDQGHYNLMAHIITFRFFIFKFEQLSHLLPLFP